MGQGAGGAGLEEGQAGQGSDIPQWQAGRQQASSGQSGGLQECEGLRAWQQETTQSSGLGLSPPPPRGPSSSCVSSFPSPPLPFSPQPKLSLSSKPFLLSSRWAVLTRLPTPPATWVLELLPRQTDRAERWDWKGWGNHLEQSPPHSEGN